MDLDPQYQPAQIVFLNLALSHTFGPRRHLFLHHPVRESPQELKDIFFAMENLLGPLDSDLLLATLERALDDRNTAVILPLVRILGKRGEQKARLVTGKAKGLIRALFYPNRRVQIEAIRSLISLKEKQSPIVTHRIVQLLSRFANSKGIPKALVVRVPEGEALEYRKNLKAAGYEAVLAPDQKAALEALHESADYDVILLHPSFPITELSFLLGQIRSDADGGLLPIMVFAPSDRQAGLQFLTSRYRNVFVKLEAVALLPKELQAEIHEAIAFSKIPNSVTRMPDRHRGWIDEMVLRNPGMGITKPERIAFAPEAVNVLWRMATGDLSGYNVSPARDAMLEILSSDNQMAFEALEVLGTFGDQKTQRFLVRVVLDSARDAQIRAQAASVLNKHIRKNGLVLSAFQIDDLRVLLEDPKTDKDLRSKLALVAGQFPGADLLSGQRLRDFRLTPVRPAVPPKEAPKK